MIDTHQQSEPQECPNIIGRNISPLRTSLIPQHLMCIQVCLMDNRSYQSGSEEEAEHPHHSVRNYCGGSYWLHKLIYSDILQLLTPLVLAVGGSDHCYKVYRRHPFLNCLYECMPLRTGVQGILKYQFCHSFTKDTSSVKSHASGVRHAFTCDFHALMRTRMNLTL